MRPTVKLWEIVTILNWRAYSQNELLSKWKYPVLRVGNFFTNSNWYYSDLELEDDKYCNNWDLLYAWSASFWPKIWEWWKTIYHYHIWKIKLSDKIDKHYLYHYLYWDSENIKRNWHWVAMMHVTKWDMEKKEIPLPPLETQKAIVAKLDQIFAELDQTKSEIQKNLDNTDELWKSALNQAFQGDWEMKKLGEVCDKVDNVKWRDNISYKYIDLTSVDRDYWNIYDTKIINSKTAPSRAKQIVKYNDILFWTTRPTQLRRCIIPIEYDNQICSTWFCVIRLKKNLIPSYLYFLLETQSFFDYVEKYQSWAGYPAISDKKLKEFCIPVPPLSEQEKIVEHLDQVSQGVKQLKSEYQSQLDNLEELKKSVLDKAFTWELE